MQYYGLIQTCALVTLTLLRLLNSQAQGADAELPEGDHIKGGLGKKMKAISMTMRKKMGKKYARALSEETVSADERWKQIGVWVFFFLSAASAFFGMFHINLSLESISAF